MHNTESRIFTLFAKRFFFTYIFTRLDQHITMSIIWGYRGSVLEYCAKGENIVRAKHSGSVHEYYAKGYKFDPNSEIGLLPLLPDTSGNLDVDVDLFFSR